jgi:hypothetical protein
MEYLKLTNTKECLKLAECLVGSDTFKVFNMEPYEVQGELLGVCGNDFLIRDSGDECDYGFLSEFVFISVESIKLNSFKCCEHSIPVVVDRGMWGKEKRDNQSTLLSLLAQNCPFELDLGRLPAGATIESHRAQ